MSEPFIAQVQIFPYNFAPRNWAFCDGQLLPISQNTALFSLLGTIYGGDGRTTFGLPNLKGRAVVHPGTGPGLTPIRLGERAGVEKVTLSEAQMAQHNHTMRVSQVPANQDDPDATQMLATPSAATIYGAAASLQPMATEELPPTGSGSEHNNMEPFLTLNFCIALIGLFPSRN